MICKVILVTIFLSCCSKYDAKYQFCSVFLHLHVINLGGAGVEAQDRGTSGCREKGKQYDACVYVCVCVFILEFK